MKKLFLYIVILVLIVAIPAIAADEKFMSFNEFKEWAFLGVITFGVAILYKLYQSVNQLNTHIAVIVYRMDNHEKRLDKLEEKVI